MHFSPLAYYDVPGPNIYLRALFSKEQTKGSVPVKRIVKRLVKWTFLPPVPNSKLVDLPSSAVRDCLFHIFTATFHIGGRSSIRKVRTRHDVVTGTHVSEETAKCTLRR